MATIANLNIAVTVNVGNSTQQLQNLTVAVNNFGNAFQTSLTKSVALGNLWSSAISRIFSAAQENFSTFVSNAIKYSQQFQTALLGLTSVANAFGVSSADATAAAKQLSADGLLPLRDSAAGLKNLLLTGFGLEDSIKIMKLFKDSAVYARQGMLSYGDAIRTATEGLKNSQSRLVDNVGITKNLSVIMKEHGFQLQDISDKTKGAAARQALLNGLLHEGAAMAGDAARSLGTYTGAVTALDTAWISLQAVVGDFLTTNKSVQVVMTLLAESLRDVTGWLDKSGKGAYVVSDALTFLLKFLKATVVGLDLTQQALSFVAIKALEFAQDMSDGLRDSYGSILKIVAVLAQLPGGQKVLDAMGVSVADLAKDYAKWAVRSKELADTTNTLKEGSSALSDVLAKGRTRLDEMIAASIKNRGALVDLGAAGRQAGDQLGDFFDGIEKGTKKLDTFRELREKILRTGDTGGFVKSIDQIVTQLPAFKKGMEEARDAMFGVKEIKAAYELATALGGVENISKLTKDAQDDLNKAVSKAMDIYHAFGVTAPKVLTDIYNATTQLVGLEGLLKPVDLSTIFKHTTKIPLSVFDYGFESMLKEVPLDKLFDPDKAKQMIGQLKGEIDQMIRQMEQSIKPVFVDIFRDLPDVIRRTLAGGGGLIDVFLDLGAMAGEQFSKAFAEHLEKAKKAGRGLTGGEKLLGLAGMGLESFVGGFDIGRSQGRAKGALGGAASGALQGAAIGSVIPGVGTLVGGAIGGIAGFFGGIFGGGKKAAEERAALEANKKALAEQYGGMAKLREIAAHLGVDIQKAFDAKNAEQFTAAVETLNSALEEQKKRIEGLNTALKAVNDRATIFASKFQSVYEAAQKDPGSKASQDAQQKLQAMAQASEAEFARLGLMIRDTFAGLVKESGSGIQALQQMAPAFQVLEDGVSKWGITSTAVIDELRKDFDLVNNEVFKPLFEQIAADGEVLKGLFDAKALSPEGFQAIAADIGQSIQSIIDKGGDAAKTFALSQPVLQQLWEAQQQYGTITDETTQKILKQAEEQGIVGEHMKSVNEKILDVLLAIGDVLGAKLPEYFEKLKKPAADAATSIEDSFNGIRVDPIEIKYRYKAENDLPNPDRVPHMAAGGIVRRPTLALIGEAGPEAVVPLTGAGLGAQAEYETSIYLDGEVIARSTAKRIPKIMRGMGV